MTTAPDPARLPDPEDLSAAEIAALCWLDPDFEPEPGDLDDPDGGAAPPEVGYGIVVVGLGYRAVECWEAASCGRWRELLGGDRDLEGFYAGEPTGDGVGRFADVLGAGFTHRDPEPGATG